MLNFSSFEICYLFFFVDRLWHLTKLNVEIEAKSVSTFFLALINVDWFHGWNVHLLILKTVLTVNVKIVSSWNANLLVRLEQIMCLTLLLNDHLLLLLLGSYLCVMLKNAFSFIRALVVFALHTFTELVTRNSCLETLTVLFQTLASFTVAAFSMSLFSIFAH
jgi:hypothetical protein